MFTMKTVILCLKKATGGRAVVGGGRSKQTREIYGLSGGGKCGGEGKCRKRGTEDAS